MRWRTYLGAVVHPIVLNNTINGTLGFAARAAVDNGDQWSTICSNLQGDCFTNPRKELRARKGEAPKMYAYGRGM